MEVTGQAVAQLTINQHNLRVEDPPSPPRSEISLENPFAHRDRDTLVPVSFSVMDTRVSVTFLRNSAQIVWLSPRFHFLLLMALTHVFGGRSARISLSCMRFLSR